MHPTEESALEFAIMLNAGLPSSEAIRYFIDTEDPLEIAQTLKRWLGSRLVKRAMLSLMRKPWHELTLDERIKCATDMHYSNLAYLLFSRNYLDANAAEKSKMDTARTALEAKMAGMAGKTDALSRFFADIESGAVKLSAAPVKLN